MLKQRADFIYVSSSENYLVMIGVTQIKILDLYENKLSKYPIQNVSKVVITNDDKYLFCVKDYSNYLYKYSLNNMLLIKRKHFLSKFIISSMIQNDDENMFLVLENRYTAESHIIKYNFEQDIEEIINVPNLKYVDFQDVIKKGNQNIFKFHLSFHNDDFIDSYYVWKNGFIRVEDESLFLNNYTEIAYSNDEKYYFISYVDIDDCDNGDYKEVSRQSNLKVFDSCNNQIIELANREFKNALDIFKKYYLGYFVYDEKYKKNIFYTKRDNFVELYYLEKAEYKKIKLDFDIMDVRISIKNNVLITTSIEVQTNCYVYALSDFVI